MKLNSVEKKWSYLSVFACALTAVLLGVWATLNVADANAKTHYESFVVVIDAGHGGIDAGVLGKTSKVKESDLNLDIAKKLKTQFEKAGIKVVMTRTSYGGLYGTTAKGFKKRDMQNRIKIINDANADVMISLHLNFFSSSKTRGATAFFNADDKNSKTLAESIQRFFNLSSGQTRDLSALKGDYFLLNQANCPAVICECGFLSNEEEEKLLLTETYRQEISQLIFKGATAFLLS